MIEENKNLKPKFHRQYEMFKHNHKPDFELTNVFELYLPFWFCRQNVVVEKDIELDRFSTVLMRSIQCGLTRHSQICSFLGVDTNSFVTSQIHFLIKNGLLDEVLLTRDVKYAITLEGHSFLNKKRKIKSVETVDFEYFYNDLSLDFIENQRFNFLVNDLTSNLVDTSQPLDTNKASAGKKLQFSGYQILQTNNLPLNRIEIPHRNKPYRVNKVDFAQFFNKLHQGCSFYDFESDRKEMHKRSICFLAFEYVNNSSVKRYDIRHFKKTVRSFTKHEIEETLSDKVTGYFKKTPLSYGFNHKEGDNK